MYLLYLCILTYLSLVFRYVELDWVLGDVIPSLTEPSHTYNTIWYRYSITEMTYHLTDRCSAHTHSSDRHTHTANPSPTFREAPNTSYPFLGPRIRPLKDAEALTSKRVLCPRQWQFPALVKHVTGRSSHIKARRRDTKPRIAATLCFQEPFRSACVQLSERVAKQMWIP